MNKQGDLFVDRPLARDSDPMTSRKAAAVIAGELGKIQRLVLDVYRARGQMTAREAERLDEFADYGFSTIRKRISELYHGGYLKRVGVDKTKRSPATIYAVNEARR